MRVNTSNQTNVCIWDLFIYNVKCCYSLFQIIKVARKVWIFILKGMSSKENKCQYLSLKMSLFPADVRQNNTLRYKANKQVLKVCRHL